MLNCIQLQQRVFALIPPKALICVPHCRWIPFDDHRQLSLMTMMNACFFSNPYPSDGGVLFSFSVVPLGDRIRIHSYYYHFPYLPRVSFAILYVVSSSVVGWMILFLVSSVLIVSGRGVFDPLR